jgi:hypothetical protein
MRIGVDGIAGMDARYRAFDPSRSHRMRERREIEQPAPFRARGASRQTGDRSQPDEDGDPAMAEPFNSPSSWHR